MTREEAIVVLKAFMDNPLFSDVHRATFSIAIHDIKQRHEWDINKLMLVPKTEWEQDHAILKAYSDGANEVLDKIRAEIVKNSIEDYKYHGCGTDELIIETSEVLQIIDKYKAESEDKE